MKGLSKRGVFELYLGRWAVLADFTVILWPEGDLASLSGVSGQWHTNGHETWGHTQRFFECKRFKIANRCDIFSGFSVCILHDAEQTPSCGPKGNQGRIVNELSQSVVPLTSTLACEKLITRGTCTLQGQTLSDISSQVCSWLNLLVVMSPRC